MGQHETFDEWQVLGNHEGMLDDWFSGAPWKFDDSSVMGVPLGHSRGGEMLFVDCVFTHLGFSVVFLMFLLGNDY